MLLYWLGWYIHMTLFLLFLLNEITNSHYFTWYFSGIFSEFQGGQPFSKSFKTHSGSAWTIKFPVTKKEEWWKVTNSIGKGKVRWLCTQSTLDYARSKYVSPVKISLSDLFRSFKLHGLLEKCSRKYLTLLKYSTGKL